MQSPPLASTASPRDDERSPEQGRRRRQNVTTVVLLLILAIGLIPDKLREVGLEDQTNIFVVSDHGFGLDGFQVNLEQSLIDAGLKQAAGSEEVVLASSSHVAAIHVKGRSPRKIFDIVRHLQAQDFTGVVFTRPRPHRFGFGADPVVEPRGDAGTALRAPPASPRAQSCRSASPAGADGASCRGLSTPGRRPEPRFRGAPSASGGEVDRLPS